MWTLCHSVLERFLAFFAISGKMLMSQSASSTFEIQAQVMELFLSFFLPYKLFRERSHRLHRSEIRGRSRETNAAVIRVICATNWSSGTSSGQVRVLTDIKTPQALCLKLVLFSAAHLKSKKHHFHVKKRKRCDPGGKQSQVS